VTPRASGSPAPEAAPVGPGRAGRNPWAILIPVLAGGLALLLLLLLVRSCAPGGGAAESGTPAPTETPTEAAPSPPAGEPSVTADADTPVRAGPGEAYPIIGALLAGQTGQVVGVSADLQWWAIRFPAGPGGAGWVSADRVTAENTDGAPVMEAPPLPTATATPPPTTTPSPTATPSPTPPQPPVAVIQGPSAGYAGERLPFDARSSTAAPGSSLVAYEWAFGDGTEASGIEVAVVYESPGIYDVVLTVSDSNGQGAQATQRVEIAAAPATPTPEPPRAVIGAPAQAQVAQAVLFDGRDSTAPVPIVQYRWTFGDGATEEGARVSHTYSAPGVYSVTLVILDADGREGTANATIEIVQAPAQPTASAEATPIAGTSWLMTGYVPQPLAAGYRTGSEGLELLGAEGSPLTGIFDVLLRFQPLASG
jgi:PKD repeat protein